MQWCRAAEWADVGALASSLPGRRRALGVTTFQQHRALDVALAVAILLLLALALVARPGRRVVALAACSQA
jgi:hypothetical protein